MRKYKKEARAASDALHERLKVMFANVPVIEDARFTLPVPAERLAAILADVTAPDPTPPPVGASRAAEAAAAREQDEAARVAKAKHDDALAELFRLFLENCKDVYAAPQIIPMPPGWPEGPVRPLTPHHPLPRAPEWVIPLTPLQPSHPLTPYQPEYPLTPEPALDNLCLDVPIKGKTFTHIHVDDLEMTQAEPYAADAEAIKPLTTLDEAIAMLRHGHELVYFKTTRSMGYDKMRSHPCASEHQAGCGCDEEPRESRLVAPEPPNVELVLSPDATAIADILYRLSLHVPRYVADAAAVYIEHHPAAYVPAYQRALFELVIPLTTVHSGNEVRRAAEDIHAILAKKRHPLYFSYDHRDNPPRPKVHSAPEPMTPDQMALASDGVRSMALLLAPGCYLKRPDAYAVAASLLAEDHSSGRHLESRLTSLVPQWHYRTNTFERADLLAHICYGYVKGHF